MASYIESISQRISDNSLNIASCRIASNIERAVADTKVWPSVFILAAKEKAMPNETAHGALVQRVDCEIGVVIVTRNFNDISGEQSIDYDEIRCQIFTLLLKYQPTSLHDPIEYVGGSLIFYEAGSSVWMDTFKTGYYLRA